MKSIIEILSKVFLTFYNFGFLDNFLQPSDKALNSIHFMTQNNKFRSSIINDDMYLKKQKKKNTEIFE